MTEPSTSLDPRRRRLLYRATHRGTRETDILIGGYVASHIGAMGEAELGLLQTLLELPDPDLADWLSGRRPIPPEHDGPLLRAMRAATGR